MILMGATHTHVLTCVLRLALCLRDFNCEGVLQKNKNKNKIREGVIILNVFIKVKTQTNNKYLLKGVITGFMVFLIFMAFTAQVQVFAQASQVNQAIQVSQVSQVSQINQTNHVGQTNQSNQTNEPIIDVNLQINASWGGGDILNLSIADLDTGERQQVAIRLSDFIGEGENAQYILLQAMDLLGGRQSGVIQIENPLFNPDGLQQGQQGQAGDEQSGATQQTIADSGSSVAVDELPEHLQDIVADANQQQIPTPPPQTLTPDGTGTVVDNIMTVNDIEFFTISTGDGSDFFLVVDRQRTSNNVYLLNTVTESDLMALAEARGETIIPQLTDNSVTQSETAPTMDEILVAIQEATGGAMQNQYQSQDQYSHNLTQNAQQGAASGVVVLAVIFIIIGGLGLFVWKVLLPKFKSVGKSNQGEIEYEEDDDDDGEHDGDYSDDDFTSVEVDEDEDDDEEDEGDRGDLNSDNEDEYEQYSDHSGGQVSGYSDEHDSDHSDEYHPDHSDEQDYGSYGGDEDEER